MTNSRLAFLLLLLSPSLFASSTPWQSNKHGRVRVVTPYTVAPEKGQLILGLQFQPIPGWHVYYRDPGDSGFPPRPDWTGSKGFARPELLFPKPSRYTLPGNLVAIGYETDVIYPVTAERTSGSFRIRVRVSYLTCGDSCVPYKLTFDLDVPTGPQVELDAEIAPILQQFIDQVPPAERAGVEIPGVTRASLPATEPSRSSSFLGILLIAFIGGLILNVMPCVLPVLSIKLLGLLQHGGQSHRIVARDALASASGIWVSFVVLSLLAAGARAAGHAVGWGIQFQQPVFVAILVIVLVLFAMNLWGLFEIHLPLALAKLGAISPEDEGPGSFFVAGLFVTLLATPCSAPFLGTAMGFALTQSAGMIFLIFLAVGTGLAFPYLALAAVPAAITWLPKPGPWMLRVRVVLGFFLIATAVWLGAVLSRQVDSTGMTLFALLVLALAMVVWWRESLSERDRTSPWATLAPWLLVVFLIAAALHVVWHRRMASETVTAENAQGLTWIPFSEAEVARRVLAGETVFVDVTADWCFTCKVNERLVLSSAEVTRAFKENHITLVKADWTTNDPAIGDYLRRMGRAGIPFYALYRPGKNPVVLSEFLVKRKVLEILNQ